ncbi:hypothetical protein [Mycobacteroides abscessus]|uniref:hypothetical protein n=1 Tax=Mycobacteroides abscessus TaxID=36809 RepID=UPI000C263562|nr:hypothetical protein [Mycobacteroides abscessus]
MTLLRHVKNEYGAYWLSSKQLNIGDLATRGDFDAPVAAAYEGKLYVFYTEERQLAGLRIPVVQYLTLDESDKQTVGYSLTTQYDFPRHNAGVAVYNGELYACYGKAPVDGVAEMVIRRRTSVGGWEPAGGFKVNATQPICGIRLVQHKECLWIFYLTQGSDNSGELVVNFMACDYKVIDSQPAVRARGQVQGSYGSDPGPAPFCTRYPVGVAVYRDRIYLALTRSDSGQLCLICTDGRLDTPEDPAAMQLWWSSVNIVATPANNAAGNQAAVFGAGPSLAVYDSLLHITYWDASWKLYDLTCDWHTFGTPKELENSPRTRNPVHTAVYAGSLYAVFTDAHE